MRLFLSGGVGNTDPALSVGGPPGAEISGVSQLFGTIPPALRVNGLTRYRMVYAEAQTTMTAVKAFVETETPDPLTTVLLAWDTGTPAPLANELTPPAGVTFTNPRTAEAAPSAGDMPIWTRRPLWIGFKVEPGAAPIRERFSISFRSSVAAPPPAPPPAYTSFLTEEGDDLATEDGDLLIME